jgi:hypothetical protein
MLRNYSMQRVDLRLLRRQQLLCDNENEILLIQIYYFFSKNLIYFFLSLEIFFTTTQSKLLSMCKSVSINSIFFRCFTWSICNCRKVESIFLLSDIEVTNACLSPEVLREFVCIDMTLFNYMVWKGIPGTFGERFIRKI